MVVWEDGKMNKSQYRKFKMMTVVGVDDFASMREVVTRRYRRLRDAANAKEENTTGAPGLSHLETWETSKAEEKHALKGRDFSRADSSQKNAGALAP